MTITLDTNLYYLQKKLNISSSRMSDYANKTVDEIIEAEAAQGNLQAQRYEAKLYNSPSELIKAFQLEDPANKLRILLQMDEREVENLMEKLELEDLLIGLNFFTKDKLLYMLESAPIEELVAVVGLLFPLEDIIKMIPEKDLDKFLTNDNLDKEFVTKYLRQMPPEALAIMIESVTGQMVEDMDNASLMGDIAGLNQDKYKDAMMAMPEEMQRLLVLKMAKDEPKVMQLFPAERYVKILSTLDKPEMMKGMIALSFETVLGMVKEIPPELKALIVTQIDTEEFAKILIKQYGQMLSQLVAA